MKFNKFKPYLKYGLFLVFMICLAGTAYADTNQPVYYNWCEGSGNAIVDSSGYGDHSINYGSTTFTLSTGQKARHFNGQNRIVIPESKELEFTDPDITFGVFFRCNSSSPTNCTYLVSRGNDICRISLDHTNSRIEYEICADGYSVVGYSDCQVELEEDYEAIVTYDGSHAQLYINGIASGKGVDYRAGVLGSGNNTNSWTIGSSPDAEHGLDGTVYAFYEYDRALNPSEILDLYVKDIHNIRDSNRPGGIALSWDDTGHIDTCYKHLSIFQKYNATCTINVNKINNREIPTQTLVNELDALHFAGWEIAAHGYNHTNSRLFLVNHTSTEWLDQEIYPNIVEITRYGYPVYTLAYPYSDRNPTSDSILAPYFRTLRTGVPNIINGNITETPLAYYKWDDSRLLYGVEIDESRDVSLESIKAGIDYAIRTGHVLVLYGHTITPNVTDRYQTSTARLDEILNYTSRNGGAFYCMGDLGDPSWVRPARFSSVTARFTVSAESILAGESVTFTDYSVNQTIEQLDFGDGSPVSSTSNVTHIYTEPGTYRANLTVSNDVSTHSMLQTITVILPSVPVANFTSDVTTGYQPLNVAFKDTSLGLPVSWSWGFGDGDTSTIKNPVHTYSAAGTYPVRLNVTNEKGSDSIQKVNYITVLPRPPSSNFTSNVTHGNAPLTVQFTDVSTGNPSSWNWNFGDGEISDNRNPVHTYLAAGSYTVSLKVSNANGTDSKSAVINVLQGEDVEDNGLPVADFTASATRGYAPLSITFKDLSKEATSISWDINDDRVEDSNESCFVYKYFSAGIYTAKLTAINENGTDSKTIKITVDEKSGGDGGGGSTGGSPEPAKNIEVKELSQVFISNGNRIKFDFLKNVTDVVYLCFDARKTAGKTTSIVEMLKNQSTLTPEKPAGEVYNYLNIWVGNGGYATKENIENAVICFRVEKSWVEEKNIDESSIVLNRYSEKKWNELPTTLLRNDDRYLYYTAETPGFSPFAITAKKIVIEILPETKDSIRNGNTESKFEKESEKAENTGAPQKENSDMPGFEIIYCIIGLSGVFLCKKRRY